MFSESIDFLFLRNINNINRDSIFVIASLEFINNVVCLYPAFKISQYYLFLHKYSM